MYRKEFEKLVIPLTDKEIYYQKNSSLSPKFYEQIGGRKDENGVYQFDMPIIHPSDAALQFRDYHYTITEKNHKLNNNIVFNKQNRYSIVPLHSHNYIEMNFVYSGQATAVINSRQLQLTTGDICIMDSGVVHTLITSSDDDIILNAIMDFHFFTNSFLMKLSENGPIARFLYHALSETKEHEQYMLFHTQNHPLAGELFENAYCEFLEPGICAKEVIESYVRLLFIELLRCYQTEKEKEYKSSNKSYITEILLYMEENCISCTLESVAQKYHFHPNYLSRAIKKATGCTFKDLVSEYRMKLAAFYLRNSEQPIHKIASDCGYKNQNFFYKKFYLQYHMTPKEFRKNTN